MSEMKKIPVILQTDIGGDIDDFWALVMILKQPWLDLKMILTDTGHTVYRAAICAKLLELAGRTDVVVGAGIVEWPDHRHGKSHFDWVKDYPVASYPGFTADGVNRFIEIVKASPEPVTLISIGPAPSLAAALKKAPEIASKIRFVGMFGSVYRDYSHKPGQSAEYNVLVDIPAARTVFSADWLSAAITPLDTCNFVRLEGELYRRIEESPDKLVGAIREVYRIWLNGGTRKDDMPAPEASSILFDTVAVHMATTFKFLKMEKLNLIVDDGGFTKIDPAGKPFDTAVDWTDLPAYEEFLVDTLTK